MIIYIKDWFQYANYIICQEFINNNNWIRYNKLFDLVKDSEPYKDLGSNTGQGTLRILDKTWKSFFVAIKDWSKNPSKYLGRPKLPRYKSKDGRFVLSFDGSHLSNSIINLEQMLKREYYNADLFQKEVIM